MTEPKAKEISAVAQIFSNKLLALIALQQLRIGEPARDALRVEDDGRGDDRPGKRPAPGLVDTGHAAEAGLEKFLLGPKSRDRRKGKGRSGRFGQGHAAG